MQQMWQIRQMMALAVLAVCSYTDIKERNIYMMPLMVTAAGAQVSLAISVIGCSREQIRDVLVSEMLLPFAAASAVLMLTAACRRYIGMGDGYMIAAFCMISGLKMPAYSMPAAFVAAAAYGGLKTVWGKRRYALSIPFAPFVLTGYLTVLIHEM